MSRSHPDITLPSLLLLIWIFPCHGNDSVSGVCTLCRNGQNIEVPDKNISIPGISGIESCSDLASMVPFVSGKDCTFLQSFGSFCGCPTIERHCPFCYNKPVSNESKALLLLPSDLEDALNFNVACGVAEVVAEQIPTPEENCSILLVFQQNCGCDVGYIPVWGADTIPKLKAQNIIPRVSGFLSIVAASVVAQDILKNKKKRERVYYQIVLGVVSFDIVTGMAFIFGPAPVYEFVEYAPSATARLGLYGAHGTMTTCQIQGFFIQLGFTSMLFNLSLATYYKLVIVNGWSEDQLKKWLWVLICAPILVGFAFSFAGIPFYDWTFMHCHVDGIHDSVIFGLVPVYGSIVVLTSIMMHVYWSVRSKIRKSDRWDFLSVQQRRRNSTSVHHPTRRQSNALRASTKSNLEREVFWQSFCYLMAFYITWPVYGVAVIIETAPYWFSLLVLLLAPMQGLGNALVYFHTRSKRRKKRGGKPKDRRSDGQQASAIMDCFKFVFLRIENKRWFWSKGVTEVRPSTTSTEVAVESTLQNSSRRKSGDLGKSAGVASYDEKPRFTEYPEEQPGSQGDTSERVGRGVIADNGCLVGSSGDGEEWEDEDDDESEEAWLDPSVRIVDINQLFRRHLATEGETKVIQDRRDEENRQEAGDASNT